MKSVQQPTSRWSTNDVAAPDAFAYWSEVICTTLVHVAARATGPTPFSGRIDHTALDGIGLSTVASGPQQVARTRRRIALDPEEYLLFNIQTGGRCSAAQDGRSVALLPGSMTVLDSTRPYTMEFPGSFSQVIVRLPRTLGSGEPGAGATATELTARGPGRLVAGFLVGLAREEPGTAALLPHAAAMLESVLDRAAGDASEPTSTALTKERIRRFVLRHLHDPALDAATAAGSCNLSPRSLFRAFADGDESFTTMVRRLRVARARHLLRTRPDLSLAAVAAQSGFGGTAQLHRAFRTNVGITPATYRDGAADGGTGCRTPGHISSLPARPRHSR
ncbi:helix-turn-helix domain-containing protein [Amycolatopsis rhabdoformis]|uniref:Helix-turn-helix domain-containing protein n=1 Tax=Amycolatopsis rhabdoformis TaxID=1448059 RepID=A0ABZ1IDP0_9PSEU|nr:helix-turn-helix domain-containing protein [Amycolatopsis rhabdoformis]WSE32199.1 helix-turn-helix domain-containing protein [Amycolatopsis rhabdoformis]